MKSQVSLKNDASFSMEKGLVDPLTEHQQKIEDYIDLMNKETTVRYLNKKKKSKFWKTITANII